MTSLISKWTLYHHDPENKDWELSGYEIIMADIQSVEEGVAISYALSDEAIKHTMWFLMRDNITPRWEDSANKNGGYFQYRVANRLVVDVWRKLMLLCFGELLITQMEEKTFTLNGISISPRKTFCTIKIWIDSIPTITDATFLFYSIPNLTHYGEPTFVPATKQG